MDGTNHFYYRRIRDLEDKASWRQVRGDETLTRLQTMLGAQQAEIRRLEDIVHRAMPGERRLSVTQDGERSLTSQEIISRDRAGVTRRVGERP